MTVFVLFILEFCCYAHICLKLLYLLSCLSFLILKMFFIAFGSNFYLKVYFKIFIFISSKYLY